MWYLMVENPDLSERPVVLYDGSIKQPEWGPAYDIYKADSKDKIESMAQSMIARGYRVKFYEYNCEQV